MSRSNSTPELLADLSKKPLTKRFLPVKRYKILYMYIVGKIEKKIEKQGTLSTSRMWSPRRLFEFG